MDVPSLLREHRDEVLAIAARHGATNVCVFGSVARGESGPESDLDLLVDMEPGHGLVDFIGLAQDLEDLLGIHVDVVTRKGVHPLLREAVLAEAVPV